MYISKQQHPPHHHHHPRNPLLFGFVLCTTARGVCGLRFTVRLSDGAELDDCSGVKAHTLSSAAGKYGTKYTIPPLSTGALLAESNPSVPEYFQRESLSSPYYAPPLF